MPLSQLKLVFGDMIVCFCVCVTGFCLRVCVLFGEFNFF